MTLVINPMVGCRYFPPGSRLLSHPKRSPLLIGTAWRQMHTGVSSLPKAITQWCPLPSQDSNLRPVNRKSDALPIAKPRHPVSSMVIILCAYSSSLNIQRLTSFSYSLELQTIQVS